MGQYLGPARSDIPSLGTEMPAAARIETPEEVSRHPERGFALALLLSATIYSGALLGCVKAYCLWSA